jgi:hypothetical protein
MGALREILFLLGIEPRSSGLSVYGLSCVIACFEEMGTEVAVAGLHRVSGSSKTVGQAGPSSV